MTSARFLQVLYNNYDFFIVLNFAKTTKAHFIFQITLKDVFTNLYTFLLFSHSVEAWVLDLLLVAGQEFRKGHANSNVFCTKQNNASGFIMNISISGALVMRKLRQDIFLRVPIQIILRDIVHKCISIITLTVSFFSQHFEQLKKSIVNI